MTSPALAQFVSTLTTSMGVDGDGIVVAPSGDIYVAGGGAASVVLKISARGTVTTFVNGVASPVGICLNEAGDFFVNNYKANSVTRISSSGEPQLFATDLNGPSGIVAGRDGTLFVAEFGAHFSGDGAAVRQISVDGVSRNYTRGSGLRDPVGIALGEHGELYIANWKSGEIYRSSGGTTSLFARIDGRVNQIAYANGYLYVPSPSLRKIFRIDRDGVVTHIAGSRASGTQDGPALQATFSRPNSIAAAPDGATFYIVDAGAQAVRVLYLSDGK